MRPSPARVGASEGENLTQPLPEWKTPQQCGNFAPEELGLA